MFDNFESRVLSHKIIWDPFQLGFGAWRELSNNIVYIIDLLTYVYKRNEKGNLVDLKICISIINEKQL